MIELLSTLSVTQIIIIIFMILFALKEAFTLFDFFTKKLRAVFNKEHETKDEKKEILEKLETLSQSMKTYEQQHEELVETIKEVQVEYRILFDEQQKTLNTLIASDIEDIKSDIVKQYHNFTEKQWIDDFSMDAIERRFARYEEEGGNSYVLNLVEKLRQLPNEPLSR